jgi:hypothetical protein
MNLPGFFDNSEILFGREQDLAFLEERARESGITAVVAPPQRGKSWLLMELARRPSLGRAPNESRLQTIPLSAPMHFLVGFASAEGSTSDQMLRAVVDLYTRWLSGSDYRDQAQVLWQQHKNDLVGKTAEAIGPIVNEISKLGGKPTEVVGGLVSKALGALVSANRDLVSGGILLPRLQGEQARELVDLLHRVSSLPIVLVMDHWEKSPDLDVESNILDAFLRRLQDWPPCHIFLGARDGPEVLRTLNKLKVGFSGEMKIHLLPLMCLDDSSGPALVRHIRSIVPTASEVSEKNLLTIIAGYPGTVSKWTKPYNAARIKTAADLQATADEAQRDHYEEFNTLIPQLSDDERSLAMGLALIPACAEEDAWKTLRPVVLDRGRASLLDSLMRKNILERALPPAYGHATRGEFACRWFREYCQAEVGDVCERLIITLAGNIRDLDSPDSVDYASALMGISGMASGVSLSSAAEALLVATSSLFPNPRISSEKLLGITLKLGGRLGAAAPLAAMGLLNTLNHAKEEQDLKRRDALLDELRTLAGEYRDDAPVRLQLAKSLLNTFVDAKEEQDLKRRDALLEELRTLAHEDPGDSRLHGIFELAHSMCK